MSGMRHRLTGWTACNKSLFEGANHIRRSAAQLQAYCSGYCFAGQEEFEHPHTMR